MVKTRWPNRGGQTEAVKQRWSNRGGLGFACIAANPYIYIFGSYFEFVVMIFVAGVDNGSVQVLLSVLAARDAVALLV